MVQFLHCTMDKDWVDIKRLELNDSPNLGNNGMSEQGRIPPFK